MAQVPNPDYEYDVYLLQSTGDESWVEARLAKPLEDQEGLRPHFFKWKSIPGTDVQKTMQDGFDESGCCAVCLGKELLGGLEQLLQKAATRRLADQSNYRLIPVLLPDANPDSIPELLRGLEPIDFRNEAGFEREFYRLVCGIRRSEPGSWVPKPVAGRSAEDERIRLAQEAGSKAYLSVRHILNDAVQAGLPAEKANDLGNEQLREILNKVTNDVLKLASAGFSVDQVTVQDSRANTT